MSTKTYDRNITKQFRSTAGDKYPHYNPVIIEYYDSSDNLLRIEHKIQSTVKPAGSELITVWYQTISGTNFTQNWPTYSYTITSGPWMSTTESGILLNTYSGTVMA